MQDSQEGPSTRGLEYSAKSGYADYGTGDVYEEVRFSGLLGRYRWRREQSAVRRIVDALPDGVSILDCPCGTGRWWPILAMRAREIHAVDISPGMIEHATERAKSSPIPVLVSRGDAEALPMENASVDYAFSFALMKHVPRPIQYQILNELSRVSRRGVICTFGVFGHASYEFWRRRKLVESYPLLPEELDWMAKAAGLLVVRRIRCTTPVGVETLVQFDRKP